MKIKYYIEVTREVAIRDEEPPAPYSKEEWDEQQIDDIGDDVEFMIDGAKYVRRETISP